LGEWRVVSLRRHQDVVSLVAAWALLLQALIGPILPSLHMTADQGVVMCTALHVRLPLSCASTSAGLVPEVKLVPPPASAVVLNTAPRFDAPPPDHAELSAARPRGPPVA
jgi:hypothetical protein